MATLCPNPRCPASNLPKLADVWHDVWHQAYDYLSP